MLLALYSLGGSARLQLLEDVWKVLHRHRAKKYNWRMAAEDWRQALRNLEGGFLTFDRGKAFFVNPSVKDFLDMTLSSDTDHLDDLLSTACLFDQVVCLWSLVKSPKGTQLQSRFKRSPQQLVQAISQNLQKPFEEKVDLGGGCHATRELDARPEVRLQTLISIADNTKSDEMLNATTDYSQWLIGFWLRGRPDFGAAVGILRALDQAKWPALDKVPREQIKKALLSKLTEGGGSGAIGALVRYAGDEKSRFSEADEQMLVRAFKNYLEHDFHYELRGCTDEDDYESLSESLSDISAWCGVDVSIYQEEIRERIDELPRPEDEEDRTVRQWESTGEPQSEYMQEREVRRIFDGLR